MDEERIFKINKKVLEHRQYLEENYPQYNIVYQGLQGSQNYNLDIYSEEYMSDVDTKVIIVPSLENIAKNKAPVSTTIITPNNEHIDVKDIREMFKNFKKQNINYLEILFSDFNYVNPDFEEIFIPLLDNREKVARYNTNQALRCMAGMSMQKLKALCHPYEGLKEKIEKYGYDGKQLHHIIRMNNFIKYYIQGYDFKECLTMYEDIDLLKDAKLNRFTLNKALKLAKEYDEETCKIAKENMLEIDNPSKEIEELLYNIQYKIIKKALSLELKEE